MENNVEQALDCARGVFKRPRAKQALAKRVREALLMLGGEAHRRTVIEQVAREMGHDVLQIPQDLEASVILSFESYWRDEARRAAYGFHLKFGEGSHRWAIRPDAAHAP